MVKAFYSLTYVVDFTGRTHHIVRHCDVGSNEDLGILALKLVTQHLSELPEVKVWGIRMKWRIKHIRIESAGRVYTLDK